MAVIGHYGQNCFIYRGNNARMTHLAINVLIIAIMTHLAPVRTLRTFVELRVNTGPDIPK